MAYLESCRETLCQLHHGNRDGLHCSIAEKWWIRFRSQTTSNFSWSTLFWRIIMINCCNYNLRRKLCWRRQCSQIAIWWKLRSSRFDTVASTWIHFLYIIAFLSVNRFNVISQTNSIAGFLLSSKIETSKLCLFWFRFSFSFLFIEKRTGASDLNFYRARL